MLTEILFAAIRYATLFYNALWFWYRSFVPHDDSAPHRAYFLSDDHEYDETYKTVPEDAVYVEEWVSDALEKLCYVRYEGDPIVQNPNPFNRPRARSPWVWVGDKDTDIDLTRTFNKFLVPGNRIDLDLVLKLIHITEDTRLMYIDAKSFEEKKFPGDGLLIEANE